MKFHFLKNILEYFSHSFVWRVLVVALLGLYGANPAYAQLDDDGVLDYSDILAGGVKIHYEGYLRQVAQSFEGKDRNPQQFSRWPDFLAQAADDEVKQAINFSENFDVRVAETWEFLDYQIAYAQIRGTTRRAEKQKLLETLTLSRIIDQSIKIYWDGLIATRYGNNIRLQQARINKLLRDSRLSNVVNSLLPEEEKQLLRISNEVITILRSFQASRSRLNQFIAQRQTYRMKAANIGIPVNYYDGGQLDQSSLRSFSPFRTVTSDAEEYTTEQRAYTEISRLFPSAQFVLFGNELNRRDVVRWHNYSSQLGWNLSNVFDTYPIPRDGVTREHARASGMALVSRNRIAVIEYQQNLINFEAALIRYNNSLWAQSNTNIYDAGSIETISSEVEKILAAVDSSNAFARLQQSYYRLLLSGGYVQIDNINPRADEASLASLMEVAVQRLLNADAVELGNRIERGVLSEYSDNPIMLRILQAWQQSLSLILSTANGSKRVSPEDTLPYLQDNVNLSEDVTMADDLIDIASDLPTYGGPASAKETGKMRAGDKDAEMMMRTNAVTLEALNKISEAADKTLEAAQTASEAATRAIEAAERAERLVQPSGENMMMLDETSELPEGAPDRTSGTNYKPLILVPTIPDNNNEKREEADFDFGEFTEFFR